MDNNTVELTERLLQNQPDPKEDRLERIFTALGAKPIDQCGTTEHPLDRVFPGINIHSLDDNEKYSAPIRTTTQKQQSNQEDLYSLDEINAAIKAASNGTTRLPQCENNIGANNLNPPSLEALQRIRDHFKTKEISKEDYYFFMRYYLKIDLSDLELENMGAIQNYIQTQIDMQRLRAPMNREEKGSLMAFLSAQFSINFSIYFNIFFGIINPFEFMTKEFDLYKIINLSRDQVTTNSFGNATMIIKSLCNEVFLDGVYQYSYIKNTLGIYPGKLLFISIYNPDTLPPGFLNKTRNSVFEFSNEVSNTLLPLCFFFCVLFSVILGGAFYRFIRNADNTFVRANRTLIACFISSLVFIGQSFTPFLSYASSIPFSAMMACGTTYRTAKGTSLLYGLTDYTEDAMSLLSIGSISFLSVISLGIAIRKALSLRRASAHLNPAAVASLVGQGQSTTTGNDSPIARSFSV